MSAREPSSVSTLVVRPGEGAGLACQACALAGPGRAAPVTVAAWERAWRRAAGRQAHDVRLAGVEPLLAPGMIEALGASTPAPLAVTVETHGLAWADVPAATSAALPIARWELIVHTLDAATAASLLGRPGEGAALARAWERGAPAGQAVDVSWQPAPGDLATPTALPAWTATRFGDAAGLSVRLPPGGVRPALLERQLATLAAANRSTRLPLRHDRALPCCVRRHLPGAEAELPGGATTGPAPALHPVLCRGCPHAKRERCAGLPAGWRLEGDDVQRLRSLARVPAFRTAADAELVALRLGLRQVVRLALPARQTAMARLALETEGFTVVMGRVRELDAEGNLFVPGAQPSTGRFAPGGHAATVHVLYVAHAEGPARRARDLEARVAESPRADADPHAHRELGALLGYPACCVEAFVADLVARAREAEDPASHFDRARAAAARSARLDPLANPFLVARDRALISHAPCAFDCKATVALASAVLAELGRSDPVGADARRTALGSAVVLHHDGSVLVTTADEAADGPRLREILRAEGRFEVLHRGDALPRDDERTLVLRFDLTPGG